MPVTSVGEYRSLLSAPLKACPESGSRETEGKEAFFVRGAISGGITGPRCWGTPALPTCSDSVGFVPDREVTEYVMGLLLLLLLLLLRMFSLLVNTGVHLH